MHFCKVKFQNDANHAGRSLVLPCFDIFSKPLFVYEMFYISIFELLNTQNPYESSLFDIPKKFHEKTFAADFTAEPRRDWIVAIQQKLLSILRVT